MKNLNDIKDSNYVKSLTKKEKKELANDIREFLITNISQTGGHLASNLGVVELTIAVHSCFDIEKDKLIFDVSHQTYTHKILTGRADKFNKLRQLDGLSGYSSRTESKYDFFETGHSSTSLSAQSGILKALEENKQDDYVVSIIGDASLSNGMSFEALNYIGGQQLKNCIIILNDNSMGISKSVGALNRFLNKFRKTKFFFKLKSFLLFISPSFLVKFFSKIKRGIKGFVQQTNIFEDLGFTYIGPVDGHNINYLIKNIELAKTFKKPVILHVLTTKGKGYKDAELDIDGDFHGVSADFIHRTKEKNNTYSFNVSKALEAYNDKYKDLFVISSGMIKGSLLNDFQKKYPKNIIDVGIAEEHAATMASGMSIMNKKVFLSYYSTFSQRAYDQINHDILRQNLKCVIGLDRSGIVGEDGSTHQGIYDLSIFSPLNCYICNPDSFDEISNVLEFAYSDKCDKTVFLRYPRGNVGNYNTKIYLDEKHDILDWYYINKESKSNICLLGYSNALKSYQYVKENLKENVDIVNALFIKPLDEKFIKVIFEKYEYIFLTEEVIFEGSLAQSIISYLYKNNMVEYLKKLYVKHITSDVPFGKIMDVKERIQLDDKSILEWVKNTIK